LRVGVNSKPFRIYNQQLTYLGARFWLGLLA
jgi:hypothetical protein